MLRAVLILATLSLAACSGNDRDITMHNLRSNTGGPDEFAVLPGKALQAPTDYAALPTPTPGGSNLTDQNPLGDAVAALGGKASALQAQPGVPSSDATMVSFVSRNGVPADIRETLAAEDLKFRQFHSRFTKLKLVPTDRYFRAYRKMTLDPYQVLESSRYGGLATPTAPPE